MNIENSESRDVLEEICFHMEYILHIKYYNYYSGYGGEWRRNSAAAEEVADWSIFSLIQAGWRQDIRPPKLVPTFPWIDNCLMVTKR